MKYILQNIRLRKVEEGKRNAGELLLQAETRNTASRWELPGTITIFDKTIISDYEPYLALAEKGPQDAFGHDTWKPSLLKDSTKPIPQELLEIDNARWETFLFPGGEMVLLDDEGHPRRNEKGNIITSVGVPVFVIYIQDPMDGRMKPARGWKLEEQGMALMSRFYAPKMQEAPQGIVLPNDPASPDPEPAV